MATNDIYDAVVVGAGLTGALVAHHLAEASLSVVVLEATKSPGGVAERGAGLALLGTPTFYSALHESLGPDTARRIWELTQQNLELLTVTANKLGQEVTQTGSFRVTDAMEILEQSRTLLKQDLFTVDVEESTTPIHTKGLKIADDLAFEPAALTSTLLDHPGITVEYEAEVQAIKPATGQPPGDTILTVWAHKRYIWTRNVVLTNGAHAMRLDQSLADILNPLAMHAVDFRTDIALPIPWVLDNGTVVVQQRGNNTWRMVGWPNGDKDTLASFADIAEELCPMAHVMARHTWWVAQSQDDLPIVGQSPSTPNVYIANGLGPWGLSWAFIVADRLVSQVIHGEAPRLLGLDRFASGE